VWHGSSAIIQYGTAWLDRTRRGLVGYGGARLGRVWILAIIPSP
jgi:hypothetical protein